MLYTVCMPARFVYPPYNLSMSTVHVVLLEDNVVQYTRIQRDFYTCVYIYQFTGMK